jgi:4-amino-4-deoxy-L-arabinose transferase-like glycosyltransferase
MTFLLGTALVVLFDTFVVSVLKPPTRIASLVGLYLLSYANVVFVAEVAGTLHSLDRLSFLFLHFALAIFGLILWASRGRPPLIWRSLNIRPVLSRRRIVGSLKSDPALYALGAGVALVYLVGAILVLTVPPNNYDSMTYHLSRVGYWLQHGSFEPWPTPNLRQTTSPMNAEMGFMWTIIFWGTDRLAGFAQWSAALVSMAAIVGLSRLLKASRGQAVFAALIWATLPEIILESTTTQNDLVAGAFCVTSVYLLYVGLERRHTGVLLLSGLGLGLAVGTKLTVPGVLPGLVIAALLLLVRYRRQNVARLLAWAGASVASILLVGVYAFALNLFVYTRPLGPSAFVSSVAGSGEAWAGRLVANLPRFVYQTIDLTGLPDPIAVPLHQIKAGVGMRVFSILNLPTDFTPHLGVPGDSDLSWRPPIHEDLAGFGPLALLLLVPAASYQASMGLTKREPFRLGLILMSLSFLVATVPLGFYPFDNRYYVVTVTLCAPFLALLWRKRRFSSPLRWATIGLALLIATWTITHNLSKPLTGARPVWQMDRMEAQLLNGSPFKKILQAVEAIIPPDGSLGTVLGGDDWDYPLFGRGFARTVVPLFPPPENLDRDWLKEEGISFVLVSDGSGAYVGRAPAGLETLWSAGKWYVLYGGEPDFGEWDSHLRSGLAQLASVVVLDERLEGAVGVAGLGLPEWGDELPSPSIWLGQGEGAGLKVSLWSDQERTVELTFEVNPGPGRTDALRRVELILENDLRVQRWRQHFDDTTALSFVVELRPGRNELSFRCLDEPTVLVQPNGDTRPLLLRLDAIRVASVFDQEQAAPPDSPLLTVDPALRGEVGLLSHVETPPWNIEFRGEESFLWLGQGDEQALRAVLSSNQQLLVDLAFDVAPGPGRPQPLRNVYATVKNESGVHRQKKTLDATATLHFAVRLEAGPNDLIFGCLDEATLLDQPSGDTRPLLVLLRGIRIAP